MASRATFVTPKRAFVTAAYRATNEFLINGNNRRRPCLLILSLVYKGKRMRFAVPLRSNISANSPRDEYFRLPNTSRTRPRNHAGLHFIKMFPVTKQSYDGYSIRTQSTRRTYMSIQSNMSDITKAAQDYLIRYENGQCSQYAVDIDAIIEQVLPLF